MATYAAQGFFTSGYFVEDKEADAPNYLRSLERKKVLSNIEQLGLLSAAEKAGLSLSKVGCLDTASRPTSLVDAAVISTRESNPAPLCPWPQQPLLSCHALRHP